jgi:hypothetical protein
MRQMQRLLHSSIAAIAVSTITGYTVTKNKKTTL